RRGQGAADLEEDVEGRLPGGDIGAVARGGRERELVRQVDRHLLAGVEVDLQDRGVPLLMELGEGRRTARPPDQQVVVEVALGAGTPVALTRAAVLGVVVDRSEEHTSELQSRENLVCRLLLEKKKKIRNSLVKR